MFVDLDEVYQHGAELIACAYDDYMHAGIQDDKFSNDDAIYLYARVESSTSCGDKLRGFIICRLVQRVEYISLLFVQND